MKNLYLFICVVIVGIDSASAQNLQNANWVFGTRAGLNFNTPTPSPASLPLSVEFIPVEGCASVSDEDGNLLFFTDGKTVWQFWNGDYVILTNALLGHYSSTQNSIIVPKPNSPQKYYIITIAGTTSQELGLHYSEIDLSNGLGVISQLNTVLNDHLGNPINGQYGNKSESITSTVHANGTDYWIVAHIKSNNNSSLYVYHVTETSINPNPLSFSFPITNFAYTLKISPNYGRIVLTTNSQGLYLGSFNNLTGSINMNTIAVGNTWNKSVYSAEFSPNSNIIYYSVMGNSFSAAGYSVNKVSVNNPSIATAISSDTDSIAEHALQLGIDSKIYITRSSSVLNVISDPNNETNPQYSSPGISLVNRLSNYGLPQWVHQQSGPCGNVAGVTKVDCSFQWNDTSDTYVIEVMGDSNCTFPGNFPENSNTPTYGTVTITNSFIDIAQLTSLANTNQFRFRIKTICGSWSDWCCFDASNCRNTSYPAVYPNGSCFYGEQPCNADIDLNITQEVISGENVLEQATNTITAVNLINNGAVVDYHANNAVILNPGFIAQTGSVFLGHIEECTYVSARPAQVQRKTKVDATANQNSFIPNELKKEYVIISPNPSSSSVDISLENLKMTSIIITSMDGRVMFNRDVKDIASYKLDISNYNTGIYMVTINAGNGRTLTGKIIKN